MPPFLKDAIWAETRLTSFGMVISWESVCAEASIPAEETRRQHECVDEKDCSKLTASAFNLPTYPGSNPGCHVQWGRGSAAWPAGEVWWAVEPWEQKRGEQTNKQWGRKNPENSFEAKFLSNFPFVSGCGDNGRKNMKWHMKLMISSEG